MLLREPLKPREPADDQAMVAPLMSVMVTIVLLKVDWMCAMPVETFLRTFFFCLGPLPGGGALVVEKGFAPEVIEPLQQDRLLDIAHGVGAILRDLAGHMFVGLALDALFDFLLELLSEVAELRLCRHLGADQREQQENRHELTTRAMHAIPPENEIGARTAA